MNDNCLLPYEKRDPSFFIFKDAEGYYGKKPEERDIPELLKYGFINLDKPSGPTSHQVVSLIKHFLELKKAGHGGTLDPKVTGILPIALEKSTKVIEYLLNAGKEYVAVMHLHKKTTLDKIMELEKKFVGEILQMPPVRSAVKRRLRKRKIYYLKILEYDEETKNVLFKVGTQAGTYIRTLCVQMGDYLGTKAHMLELRRTKAGSLSEKDNLVNMIDVKDSYYIWKKYGDEEYLRKTIIPVEKAINHLPKVILDYTTISAVLYGASIRTPGIVKSQNFEKGEKVAIFSLKGELIALGEALYSLNEIKQFFENRDKREVIKTNKVLKERDYFPKLWKR